MKNLETKLILIIILIGIALAITHAVVFQRNIVCYEGSQVVLRHEGIEAYEHENGVHSFQTSERDRVSTSAKCIVSTVRRSPTK